MLDRATTIARHASGRDTTVAALNPQPGHGEPGGLAAWVARGLPLAAAFKQARVFGPQQRAFEAALGRLGRPALLAAVQHAARADRIVKGLLRGNIGDELERLALRLMPQP